MTNRLLASALAVGCRKLVVAGTCLEYADLPRYPPVLVSPQPVLVVAVAGGLAVLLGTALAASGYALLRAAVPTRLREAQA